MSAPEKLKEVVEEGRAVRALDGGVYSVLPEGRHAYLYDRRAAVYDIVVGTRVYNRVLWGAARRGYTEFARRAFASDDGGTILDAACGSLLFSAPAYVECGRRIIAFDQSVAMLRRARARLSKVKGSAPENVVLLQGDLGELPFRPGSFQTVLCMNVLHQFEDAASLLPKLEALVGAGGKLFLTSLVRTGRLVGDKYLDLLHKSGEFVRPRGAKELEELLRRALEREVSCRVEGNMLYAATAGTV